MKRAFANWQGLFLKKHFPLNVVLSQLLDLGEEVVGRIQQVAAVLQAEHDSENGKYDHASYKKIDIRRRQDTTF